jgi:hypothetical protein
MTKVRLPTASAALLTAVVLLVGGTTFTDLGGDAPQRAWRAVTRLTQDSPVQVCSRIGDGQGRRRCFSEQCLYHDPALDAPRCRAT